MIAQPPTSHPFYPFLSRVLPRGKPQNRLCEERYPPLPRGITKNNRSISINKARRCKTFRRRQPLNAAPSQGQRFKGEPMEPRRLWAEATAVPTSSSSAPALVPAVAAAAEEAATFSGAERSGRTSSRGRGFPSP